MHQRVVFALVFALLLVTAGAGTLSAQVGALPRANYYRAFTEYYFGDLQRAGRDFQQASTTAFRLGNERFLDSVCAWTMMGECHFHQGNYADALTNYNRALNLYLAFNRNRWQSRVQPPATLSVSAGAFGRSRINWGTPARNAKIPTIPETFLMQYGRVDAGRAFREGGAFDQAELRPVNVSEIMRCTALAMHRRKQILGGISEVDPLSRELLAGMALRNAGDGSILGSYNGVLLGLAYASNGKLDSAASMFERSLQISGGFDHPLTPVALVELSKLTLEGAKFDQAATLALEASYSAGVWEQYDLIGESMSVGTLNHILRSPTPYPPLPAVIAWANRENVRSLQYSATQMLAESHAEAGNSAAAREAIASSKAAFRNRNRSLGNTTAAARMQYTAALASFQEGNFAAGLSELTAALSQYRKHSLWLFRLQLANTLVAEGSVSERDADRLYETLLHDPTEPEWRLDPIEPISFLAADHVSAMENWLEILISRRRFDKAVEVADLIRRHRFFSTLPMGGRLLAFRHSLGADRLELDPATLKQRNLFLQNNGTYANLIAQATGIEKEMRALPINPKPGSAEEKQQAKLVRRLSEVSSTQEALLASYSLSRIGSNLSFPPQMPVANFQKTLRRGVLCLSCLKTANGYHMFFVSRERIRHAFVGKAQAFDAQVQRLLKEIGATGSTADSKRMQTGKWQEHLITLKEALFAGIPDEAFGEIVELVVVPDGLLWYVPLEAIPLAYGGDDKTLIEMCPIRYSPTLFLSAPRFANSKIENMMLAHSKMHPRGETEPVADAVTQLKRELRNTIAYDSEVFLPTSLHSWLPDHLMVWSSSGYPDDVYQFAPVPFDRSSLGSVASWMSLPAPGPRHLSLPALQPLGNGRGVDGSEMFLMTTAMMASGVRSIMLSRWAGGGKASIDLSGSYAKKLPETSAAKALRESILETRKLDFVAEDEPQVKIDDDAPELTREHPFFWSSFLVVDSPRLDPANVAAAGQPVGSAVVVPANPVGSGSGSKTPAAGAGSATTTPPPTTGSGSGSATRAPATNGGSSSKRDTSSGFGSGSK